MFTIPKTFSEVMAERAEIAKATGDPDAEWMEDLARRTSAKSAERVAKASAVERAGNIIAQRIGMAKPPSTKEELCLDDLDEAVTYALRRLYPEQTKKAADGVQFDAALESVVKADPGIDEDWLEKSYADGAETVDVLKREKVTQAIDGLVEELRKGAPDLSYDQAVVKVIEQHPALYEQYVY